MENSRPFILVTNDDGYDAEGIRLLAKIASEFGEVLILAPKTPQSGMSSAVSSSSAVYLEKEGEEPGIQIYSATGTPVDCVKLAFYSLCKDHKPDLILSGINKGGNSSINVIYSGTMGAVIEGCLNDIPSVGFSLLLSDFTAPANYSFCHDYVREVLNDVLKNRLPEGVCLNVNFPVGKIEGPLVWCRQAKAHWTEEFTYVGNTEDGRQHFQLGGNFSTLEPDAEDCDVYLLDHHRATIVPIRVDMTDYNYLKTKAK